MLLRHWAAIYPAFRTLALYPNHSRVIASSKFKINPATAVRA